MSYYEMLKDIEDTDKNINKLVSYNKVYGGGMLWIILYWPLYITFIYELVAVKEKITTASEILGIALFFMFGIFLTYGVLKHIKLNSLLYKKMSEGFQNTIEMDKRNLFDAIDKEQGRPMPQYGVFNAEVKKLDRSLQNFKQKYMKE
jgi:hypothetical protein